MIATGLNLEYKQVLNRYEKFIIHIQTSYSYHKVFHDFISQVPPTSFSAPYLFDSGQPGKISTLPKYFGLPCGQASPWNLGLTCVLSVCPYGPDSELCVISILIVTLLLIICKHVFHAIRPRVLVPVKHETRTVL